MALPEQVKSARADQKIKILGLAFAGADLAFEVDQKGAITFALGAAEQIAGVGHAALIGAHWSSLVSEDDAALLGSLLGALLPGERQGPLRVTLRHRKAGALTRLGSLSVFRLPQNEDGLSCALSLGAPSQLKAFPRNAVGLLDRETFDEATASIMVEAGEGGTPVRLTLVQLRGLNAAIAALDAPAAEIARKKIAAALRLESYSGVGATEIADDRFAFVRAATAPAGRVSRRLARASADGVTLVTADMNLDAETPAQSLRAVRYALDRYIEDEPAEITAGFEAMLERTAHQTAIFKSTLSTGAVRLVYQPVVNLARNAAHHFEALVRFEGAENTGDSIRLAEEIGMIVDFDLAVAKTVVAVLRNADAGLKIAVNVSAISLMTPRFVDAFTDLTEAQPSLRQRLLLEITETQKLHDLPKANRVLTGLRRLGHAMCLDDFGAGAATLDYLSHLEVEFIKIDGRYIKALESSPRDAVVIKHLVALCRDLGVSTIAEMVETPDAAVAIQKLGVTFGQGWLFGKPTATPTWSSNLVSETPTARRRGVVDQWG